ncbi:MAG TPA: cupredoxin domain-containing protein [Casimicrobiaceae bacterium]|jgi:plastocyanin
MNLRLFLVIVAVWSLPAFAEDVAVYKIVAKDGKLEPAVIEVPAGKRFKLEVANEGKTAIEFESKDLKQEKVVAPGAKTSLSINALKPGEYKFFDEFHEATAKGKIVAK